MFSTKFWGICWITLDQKWTGFGGAVELCDFKGVETKCELSNFGFWFVFHILYYIWNSSKIIKNLQKTCQPDAKNFISITGNQVVQSFSSKILNIFSKTKQKKMEYSTKEVLLEWPHQRENEKWKLHDMSL